MKLKDKVTGFVKDFVYEAAEPPAPATDTPNIPPPQLEPAPTARVGTSPVVEQLRAKIEAVPAYLDIERFQQSLDALAEFVPDEAQRYRAVAKQLNCRDLAQRIQLATEQALAVIGQEQQKFAATVVQVTEAEIGERERELASVKQLIEEAQAKISGLLQRQDAIAQQIGTQKLKIAQGQESFNNAVRAATAEIQGFSDKFNLYLGAASNEKKGATHG